MMTRVNNLLWLFSVNVKQILRVDFIRFLVCYVRYVYFYSIRKNFKTFYPIDYVSEAMPGNKKEKISTVEYNASYRKLKSFFEIFNQFSGYRSQRLVTAVSVCFSGSEGLRNKKCLSLGPRTESEIFSLVSHGAKFKDIFAIDIQTYSPKIIPADITDIPFQSDFFDCIIAGWILPYVTQKKEAADEIIRVCKEGALVAISHSWYKKNDALSNGDFTDGQQIDRNDEIIRLFEKNTQCVIFNYDQGLIDPSQKGDLITVLRIKKSA